MVAQMAQDRGGEASVSRATREKKLKKVWRQYLTRGKTWTREGVAERHGCRIEDIQRLIDEAGPSKVQEIDRRAYGYHSWQPRIFAGQLPPVRRI